MIKCPECNQTQDFTVSSRGIEAGKFFIDGECDVHYSDGYDWHSLWEWDDDCRCDHCDNTGTLAGFGMDSFEWATVVTTDNGVQIKNITARDPDHAKQVALEGILPEVNPRLVALFCGFPRDVTFEVSQ